MELNQIVWTDLSTKKQHTHTIHVHFLRVFLITSFINDQKKLIKVKKLKYLLYEKKNHTDNTALYGERKKVYNSCRTKEAKKNI